MTQDVCRGCRKGIVKEFFSLGSQPLANVLPGSKDLSYPDQTFPLAVGLCGRCYLVQLTETVPPAKMFIHYTYLSSFSPALVRQAGELVTRIVNDRRLGFQSFVIEIGSNDGYLLQHYLPFGVPVLGIDPAENIRGAAEDKGVRTLPEFFGPEVAKKLVLEGTRADVIHANNVLAHVEDVNGTLAAAFSVLKEDGVLIVETPYIRDMIEKNEFDTIYHEHVFYYSLSSLKGLAERHGFFLGGVELIPAHGGSLRVFLEKERDRPLPGVEEHLADEVRLGLQEWDYYASFADRTSSVLERLKQLLVDRQNAGDIITGYGAAAKATVLLNALGSSSDLIRCVADMSPYKQGRFIPGARIPIVDPREMLEEQPDVILILAWNYADEIIAAHSDFKGCGGHFIIPIPEPRLI